jgi:putative proteasome-type protease
MQSNVSVGPPVDILCYKSDSLQANMRTRLDEGDPYLEEIGRKWQDGVIKLVKQMPEADFAKPVVGFASAA